ncbi:MAG TPA: DNA-directed RNA polymerase subunit alpha [bacterium]|nr:DNA-directed RNA polymerase subunit alpha [bacterium]
MFYPEPLLPSGYSIDELNDKYGRFILSPLERGYGITIGNALRRVLLSSVPGYSVVAMRIIGILHEFTSIEGILEDVTNIKLNVKQIKVNVINEIEDRIILRAEKKGKGQLKAGDFKSEVPIEIVNPDLVIANLVDDNANIDMELWVMKGFGYVPVERFEENFKKTFPEGTIFVDAWFSPVQKVNFRVENIRIRERTDYEKLTFEIWTDGRVSPKFALNYGFNFLKKAFDKCSKEIEAAKVEEKHISYEKKEKIAYLLKQPIEYLELSKRILKSLKEHGIYRIRDIIETDKDTLLKIKNFGKKSLEELERKLAEHDLKIGMNLEIYLKEE